MRGIKYPVLCHRNMPGLITYALLTTRERTPAYSHIHTHTCMHTHMHAHTYACTHTHVHTYMHTYIHTQLHVQATIHEQIPWMLSISANAFPPPDHISCTAVTKRWGLLSYATKQRAVERQDLIGRSATQRQSISSCSCPLCKHTHKFTLTTCS